MAFLTLSICQYSLCRAAAREVLTTAQVIKSCNVVDSEILDSDVDNEVFDQDVKDIKSDCVRTA